MTRLRNAVEAARAGDLARVQALVREHPDLLGERDEEQHSLFDHATWALLVGDWSRPPTLAPDPEGRRMAIVRWLLDQGVDPNGRSQDGWTPLHTALYENHVGLTRELLRRGALPRAEVYADGGTPLLQALFWGHAEAADLLAEHDIHPRNLRVAAGLGREDLVAACFSRDGALTAAARAHRAWYRPHADLPAWTPSDDPQEVLDEALTYAVRSGRAVTVLDALRLRGADVNAGPYLGTALHWAVNRGSRLHARWLLARGADVNARATFGAQRGTTALHIAAWLDRLDMAELLVEAGADPTVKDASHDGTPHGWAVFMKSARVAAYLADLGPASA